MLSQPEQVEGAWHDHRQNQEGGQKKIPTLAEGCGVLRVRQLALGINTQEPRSGRQQEDRQREGGPWEAQHPWLGPQILALRIVT